MLKQRGATWVRLDHAGKDLDRGQRGSSAKGDDVDVVWRLDMTDNGVTFHREAARMSWVPPSVDFVQLDDPFRFDLRRSPNDHVGFGAGGPHFCLGANLARREIRVMFEELLQRLPDIEVTSEPDMLQSSFIHGIKRMKASFTPR